MIRKNLKIFIPLAYLISLSYYLCNQYLGYDFMSQAFGLHPRDLNASARMYPLFFAGSLLYLFSRKIRVYPVLSVLCVAAGVYFTWLAPYADVLQWTQLILAYGIIGLGCSINVSWARTNDISYGVYVYAWPVQQILVMLGSVSLGLAANIFLDLILTFGVAWLSWMFIEKPAMNLARHPIVTGSKRRESSPPPTHSTSDTLASQADEPAAAQRPRPLGHPIQFS